jgi:hypothetical protein
MFIDGTYGEEALPLRISWGIPGPERESNGINGEEFVEFVGGVRVDVRGCPNVRRFVNGFGGIADDLSDWLYGAESAVRSDAERVGFG